MSSMKNSLPHELQLLKQEYQKGGRQQLVAVIRG